MSVSLPQRCPTWEEMELVRKAFTAPGETWMQFGVPDSQHVNYHPFCLHWWRPTHKRFPLPPPDMIGPKTSAA